MMKKDLITHYRDFSQRNPILFVKDTYPDLQGLSEGYDPNGLLPGGTCPDIGEEAWKEVVEALEPYYTKAVSSIERHNQRVVM
jgi:hypothetical protein